LEDHLKAPALFAKFFALDIVNLGSAKLYLTRGYFHQCKSTALQSLIAMKYSLESEFTEATSGSLIWCINQKRVRPSKMHLHAVGCRFTQQ